MIKNSDLFWVRVIRGKYTKNANVIEWTSKQNSSHIWRGIVKAQPLICKGIKWIVWKGDKVKFWKDWWCGERSLNKCFNINVDSDSCVDSIILNNSWFLSDPNNGLTDNMKNYINDVYLPIHHCREDTPSWGPNFNGKFSIKSAYELLNCDISSWNDSWSWLWGLKIPAKIITFFWLMFNDRLMSNSLRAKRHV